MKRIGILTAGGDTPALNATIYGAVVRANQLRIEMIGLIKGYSSLLCPAVPHLRLNPLFQAIPELDPTVGGTMLGASRAYVSADDTAAIDSMIERLGRLKLDGLICIGGDGTMNGMQPLAERFPTVMAPKTIDNDLGLNYPNEPDEWLRQPCAEAPGYRYTRSESRTEFDLDQMINYCTPGYATAVYVAASGIRRVRTTAESHRRIAIIEVMGRHSGYIALGAAYGQPDITLVPESPVNFPRLVERIKEVYELQKNVVIICGEGVIDESGEVLGDERSSTDPAGNVLLSGAAEALRRKLMALIGDDYFRVHRREDSAAKAIFTRKVGHTQRGGRPIQFDRHYGACLGEHAVDMLIGGQTDAVSVLEWNQTRGFFVDSYPCNRFVDKWGLIHARELHPSFYDARLMKPSRLGIEYLLPIFTTALGHDDVEHIRRTVFDAGNLLRPYHSINTDVQKRICYLKS